LIIEKNKLYCLSYDSTIGYNTVNMNVFALTLDCLYECTWANADVNDVDYDMIPVLVEDIVRYVWPYELKEISES
jgi:hypothetical protein